MYIQRVCERYLYPTQILCVMLCVDQRCHAMILFKNQMCVVCTMYIGSLPLQPFIYITHIYMYTMYTCPYMDHFLSLSLAIATTKAAKESFAVFVPIASLRSLCSINESISRYILIHTQTECDEYFAYVNSPRRFQFDASKRWPLLLFWGRAYMNIRKTIRWTKRLVISRKTRQCALHI